MTIQKRLKALLESPSRGIKDEIEIARLEKELSREKVYVTTIIRQEIEVPEGTDKQDIFNFLAENQSFRDAFCGVSTDAGEFRITDIQVVDEDIEDDSELPLFLKKQAE